MHCFSGGLLSCDGSSLVSTPDIYLNSLNGPQKQMELTTNSFRLKNTEKSLPWISTLFDLIQICISDRFSVSGRIDLCTHQRPNSWAQLRQKFQSCAGIFKLLRSPGIDSKESIPPAYVVWQAGTSNRVGIQAWLLGSLKGLQIRALYWIFRTIYRG